MDVTRLVCAAVLGLSVLAGCDDDHGHDEGHHGDGGDDHHHYTEACQAIIEVCHDVDDGDNAEIAECHGDIAHDNDDAMCRSERARCIALCTAAAADAGDEDAGQ